MGDDTQNRRDVADPRTVQPTPWVDDLSLLRSVAEWRLRPARWRQVSDLLDQWRAARAIEDRRLAASSRDGIAVLGLAEARRLGDLPDSESVPMPPRIRLRHNVLVHDLHLVPQQPPVVPDHEPTSAPADGGAVSGDSTVTRMLRQASRRLIQIPPFDRSLISFAGEGPRTENDDLGVEHRVHGMRIELRSLDRDSVELFVTLEEVGVPGDLVGGWAGPAGGGEEFLLPFGPDVDGSVVGLIEFSTRASLFTVDLTLPFPASTLTGQDADLVRRSVRRSSQFGADAWVAATDSRDPDDPVRAAVLSESA
jgi:hypothetical protein